MNAKKLLKITAVTAFTTGIAVGCASSGTQTTESQPETSAIACEGSSPEARNAIYAAKLKTARAKNLGFDATENDKLIESATNFALDCNDNRAMPLVQQAEATADEFITQYHADKPAVVAESSPYIGAYLVESGDNLWSIAAKDSVYGNPYQWPLIYKANLGEVKDADLIFPGQSLNIPKARAIESAAAIAHAKNRGAWTLGSTEASDLDYLAQ